MKIGTVTGQNWATKTEGTLTVALNTEITAALQKEGLAREFIRTINQLRKESGLTISDQVTIAVWAEDPLLSSSLLEFKATILAAVLRTELTLTNKLDGQKALISCLEATIVVTKI